jgi:hypothetical protein
MFKEIIALYTENNTRPINIKRIVTDYYNRWYIQLPVDFKQLISEYSASQNYRSRTKPTESHYLFLICCNAHMET